MNFNPPAPPSPPFRQAAEDRTVRFTRRSLRTLSLLLFGVLLAVTLQMSPSQQPWLMAKLIALVIYIGLGVMALKRPARGQKLVAGVAALAVFGYMVGAAITKSAWSWLT